MDAFAAAICMAASSENLRLKNMLAIAAFFGGFQALMPYLGWQASVLASSYVEKIDHWIAAGLLYYIGGKMIFESFKNKAGEVERKSYGDPKNIYVLFALSIAT
ncbi:MAG: manganese efflux pump, partial [Opitutales bacterium]|nr:manganese efflux pump [Opitutales bacterium]